MSVKPEVDFGLLLNHPPAVGRSLPVQSGMVQHELHNLDLGCNTIKLLAPVTVNYSRDLKMAGFRPSLDS